MALVMAGTLAATPSLPAGRPAVAVAPAELPCPPGSEWQMADLVNSFRTSHGAWELPLSAELTRKAQEWSAVMAEVGALQHSPLAEGVSPGFTAVSENVAVDVSVASAEMSFEQSDVHRGNLLGAFTEMGIGVTRDDQGRVWVAQVFAQRSEPTPSYRGPVDATAFVPVVPVVVHEPAGLLAAGAAAPVAITGDGIPFGATAAVVTVEAVAATDRGELQLLLPGSRPGETSAMVVDGPGSTTTFVAPLDADGRLVLVPSVPVRLRLTVSGAFVPAGGAARAGRFVPVTPVAAGVVEVDATSTANVRLAGTGGVPTGGVSAVVLQAVVDGAAASVGGVPAVGLTVVPLQPDGSVSVESGGPSRVTLSVTGWFTDGTARASTAGLFVPVVPGRVLESGDEPVAGGRHAYVPGRHNVPACPSAVAATVSVVAGDGGGAVQVGPYRGFAPGSAPLLLAGPAGTPGSAGAVVATGDGFDLGAYSSGPARVEVDLYGWFV